MLSLTKFQTLGHQSYIFFDESSVVKTTGKRKYGSAVLGEPAIEVQRYASNSNYTINLLHSINGVDFFNILDGPSNGMELLTLFDEALQLEREDGSATLKRGDCFIMDNCGFHHARFVEPILKNMFADCGITLLFQPPYSLDFTTCEFCFRQIKDYLRRYNYLQNIKRKSQSRRLFYKYLQKTRSRIFATLAMFSSFNCLHVVTSNLPRTCLILFLGYTSYLE